MNRRKDYKQPANRLPETTTTMEQRKDYRKRQNNRRKDYQRLPCSRQKKLPQTTKQPNTLPGTSTDYRGIAKEIDCQGLPQTTNSPLKR